MASMRHIVASTAIAVLATTLMHSWRPGWLVASLVGVAAGVAVGGGLSALAANRMRARAALVAVQADRYLQGDLSRHLERESGDPFDRAVLALDAAVHALERRLSDLTQDRLRLEAILTGMVEGVIVVGERGRVDLVNAAARRMLGLDEDAVGRHYRDLVRHPDIASQIESALFGRTAAAVELALTPDGTRSAVARAAPVSGPRSFGAVVVLHDISDLRRADRMRRDFVANVSHELRTPLTAIRGYVEALLDASADPRDVPKFLEIIARQSSRMEQIVKDLLRLARLDAHQETLDLTDCSVERLFAAVVADLTPSLDARRQTVALEVAADARSLEADPAKLHDITRNLLENASAYSPEGSPITLGARREQKHILLTVADRGPGIPDADLARIFERFYRVDKARSRERGGTGLGLSIVRHLVELHGGEVTAANRPGGGAIFTVRLPERQPPGPSPQPPRSQP